MPVKHAADIAWLRMVLQGVLPHAVCTGTTHATANTQSLVNHGLKDDSGKDLKPSMVIVFSDIGTTTVYPVKANHTATQIDVRSSGSAIAWTALVIG